MSETSSPMSMPRSDTDPVRLYAEFEALPGHEAEVAALVRQLTDDVRAEPGCVVFDAWVRSERPSEYVVFEIYRDRAAFEAHIGSPHSAVFNGRLGPLVAGGGSRLTWLSEVPQP